MLESLDLISPRTALNWGKLVAQAIARRPQKQSKNPVLDPFGFVSNKEWPM
jgi:hypothetical protein